MIFQSCCSPCDASSAAPHTAMCGRAKDLYQLQPTLRYDRLQRLGLFMRKLSWACLMRAEENNSCTHTRKCQGSRDLFGRWALMQQPFCMSTLSPVAVNAAFLCQIISTRISHSPPVAYCDTAGMAVSAGQIFSADLVRFNGGNF